MALIRCTSMPPHSVLALCRAAPNPIVLSGPYSPLCVDGHFEFQFQSEPAQAMLRRLFYGRLFEFEVAAERRRFALPRIRHRILHRFEFEVQSAQRVIVGVESAPPSSPSPRQTPISAATPRVRRLL